MGLLFFSTLTLAFASWMSDDFAPLRDWVLWLLVLEGAWLGVVGVVYAVVKLRRVWAERRAQNRAGVSSSG